MRKADSWIRIAPCNEFPLREGRVVTIGHSEIAIFNLGDRFLAVENKCPHKRGPLADGIVSGSVVVCPLHVSKISLETGSVLSGPGASSCVETFRTRVENGIVHLEISDNARRQATGVQRALPSICAQPAAVVPMTDYPSAAEA